MRLDEAIEIRLTDKGKRHQISTSSVRRFTKKRTFAMTGAFLGGTILGFSGIVTGIIPVGIASILIGVGTGRIDKSLDGRRLKKELIRLDSMVAKRKNIVNNIKNSGGISKEYFNALRRPLSILKNDIKAASNYVIDELTKLKDKDKGHKFNDDIDNTISNLRDIIKENKRTLNEALEVLPLTWLGAIYLKDKFSKYKTFRDIKKLYDEDNDSQKYKTKLRKLIWKYADDITVEYYRDFITEEDYNKQMESIVSILSNEQYSLLLTDRRQ